MRLSANFNLGEFTRSGTARREGISNAPTPEVVASLWELVEHVLQPAREACGPIHVSSGYRSPKLNKALKGARNSDHMYGRAGDIDSHQLHALGKWIQDNCRFKQLIYEFGEWLHVSYDPNNNKCQVLEAYHEPYVNWLGRKKYRTRYRTYRFD